jgi:sporulation protein YlmC with PRC-barrel domain
MQVTFTGHLKGRTVIDDAGNVIGTLEDVLIDVESVQVDGLRVKLSREASKDLGAPSGMFHSTMVDVPRAMIRAVGDAVILSASRAALQQLLKPAEQVDPQREINIEPPH